LAPFFLNPHDEYFIPGVKATDLERRSVCRVGLIAADDARL
jgi:hypothetical protein